MSVGNQLSNVVYSHSRVIFFAILCILHKKETFEYKMLLVNEK